MALERQSCLMLWKKDDSNEYLPHPSKCDRFRIYIPVPIYYHYTLCLIVGVLLQKRFHGCAITALDCSSTPL